MAIINRKAKKPKEKKKPRVPKRNTFVRLQRMGEDRMNQMQTMLRQGWSANRIAAHIQVEWKLNTDIGLQTLAKYISKYKLESYDLIHGAGVLEALTKETEGSPRLSKTYAFLRRFNEFKGELDTYEAMNEIAKIHLARFKKSLVIEDSKGCTTEAVTKEGATAFRMIRELHEARLDMGLVPRTPKTAKANSRILSQATKQEQLSLKDEGSVYNGHAEVADKINRLFSGVVDGDFEDVD